MVQAVGVYNWWTAAHPLTLVLAALDPASPHNYALRRV
jgi:hypothetical protein